MKVMKALFYWFLIILALFLFVPIPQDGEEDPSSATTTVAVDTPADDQHRAPLGGPARVQASVPAVPPTETTEATKQREATNHFDACEKYERRVLSIRFIESSAGIRPLDDFEELCVFRSALLRWFRANQSSRQLRLYTVPYGTVPEVTTLRDARQDGVAIPTGYTPPVGRPNPSEWVIDINVCTNALMEPGVGRETVTVCQIMFALAYGSYLEDSVMHDRFERAAPSESPVEIHYCEHFLNRLKIEPLFMTVEAGDAALEIDRQAELLNADEQLDLGDNYYFGRGVEQNYEEAAGWYLRAAEQGDARAQTSLGYLYYRGYGVEQDHEEAAWWYRRAAEQGDPRAQNSLGNMYQNGEGVVLDAVEAASWHHRAASQGYVAAQYNLGHSHYWGLGVDQDCEEAVRWYRLAAERGDARAQGQLGYMYYGGCGVERDREKAVWWYRQAAEQGDPWAETNLGVAYMRGHGVVPDPVGAVSWYRKAAARGFGRAQYWLGVVYRDGEGVAADAVAAHMWFSIAAENGESRAPAARQAIEGGLTREEIGRSTNWADRCKQSGYDECDYASVREPVNLNLLPFGLGWTGQRPKE